MAARCWAARRPRSSALIRSSFSPPANAPASVSGRSKSACRTLAPRSARSESASGRRVVRMTSEALMRSRISSAVKRPSWPDAPVMTMLIEPAFLEVVCPAGRLADELSADELSADELSADGLSGAPEVYTELLLERVVRWPLGDRAAEQAP